MTTIRIVMADDEEPARNRMLRLLQEFEELEIVATAQDGLEALDQIIEYEPDIAFLDIEMPGLTGLEVVENLPLKCKTQIVFVTAYNEYAIKAFEINSLDYLLKPLNKERLEKTIEKIKKQTVQEPVIQKVEDLHQPMLQNGFQFSNKIPIPTADRFKLIDIDDIICAEIEDRAVLIMTAEKDYILHLTLEQLEKKLPEDRFLRINRSAIINLNAVKEFIIWFGNRFKIVLKNNHEIISSREKSKIIKQMLNI